jgi:hypothetical protein
MKAILLAVTGILFLGVPVTAGLFWDGRIELYDCDGDGKADCVANWCVNFEPDFQACVHVGSAFCGLFGLSPDDPYCNLNFPRCSGNCKPVTISPPPPLSSAAMPSATKENTFQFGNFVLQISALAKCAYFQERPYTSVVLRKVGRQKWFMVPEVVVDTGADLCVFPFSIAEALGIDFRDCSEMTSTGVAGVRVKNYGCEIEMGIVNLGSSEEAVDGYILGCGDTPLLFTAFVAFSPVETVPGLLGRRDILKNIELLFGSMIVTLRAIGGGK